MNTEMLADTLHIYERLKKAKATDAISKEIAHSLGALIEDEMAKKTDLQKTEAALKNDLFETKEALKNDLQKTELELKINIQNTELSLQKEIAQSKSETIRWIIGWTTGLIVAQSALYMSFLKSLL